MLLNQKKVWIPLLGLILIGSGFWYSQMSTPNTSSENDAESPLAEERIDTLEKFVAIIQFSDGSILPQDEASGFYYDWDSQQKEAVLYFSPKTFFNVNKTKEALLKETAKGFLTTKILSNIMVVKADDLAPKLKSRNQFHKLDQDGTNTFLQKKESLLKKLGSNRISEEELEVLGYAYTLEGNYEKSIAMDRVNCTRNKVNCTRNVEVLVTGTVKDSNGAPLSGVSVLALNYTDITPTKTNSAGQYSLKINTKDLDKIRMRAIKQGYSDGFEDFYVVTDNKNQARERDFVITKAHGMVQIDTKTKTAKNESLSKKLQASVLEETIDTINKTTKTTARYENGKFIIETDLSVYKIPDGAIVKEDGTPYRGNVTIYVYEFDKNSDIENMLRADATDELKVFIGTILKTFGMPFLQFYSEEDEELFVTKSNPIILTSQIAEMEALMTGSDEIYEPLTLTDMEKLVNESALQPNGYPINRQYLIDNELLRFPAWWILDRKRGMWDSVPVNVLDTKGLIKTIFYSITK